MFGGLAGRVPDDGEVPFDLPDTSHSAGLAPCVGGVATTEAAQRVSGLEGISTPRREHRVVDEDAAVLTAAPHDATFSGKGGTISGYGKSSSIVTPSAPAIFHFWPSRGARVPRSMRLIVEGSTSHRSARRRCERPTVSRARFTRLPQPSWSPFMHLTIGA